ncbi:prepilin peptidase [Kitasatospora sp. NBC_00315]|uniref:prepilin peptidase n=1 Tax=Kitasatospora sp. NBC_00315 TaxID=2975963 RepID=UPI003254F6F9
MNGAVILAVTGAVAGAALAPLLRGVVVRHAVPYGEALQAACPHCARAVRALPPSGRCPGCGGRLGPGTGQVEAVAAAVGATVLWTVAAGAPDALPLLWTAGFGVVLGFVDGAVRRLPDALTLRLGLGLAVLLPLAALVAGTPGASVRCLWVALAAGLLFEVPAWFGLLGGGDSRLALSLGAVLGRYGWGTAFTALFLASAAAGLWGTARALAAWARRRPARGIELPFGPFMLVGTLLAIVLAQG